MADTKFEWYGPKVLTLITDKVYERIFMVCTELVNYIRQKLSVTNVTMKEKKSITMKSNGTQKIKVKVSKERGNNPSAPGEYPKKLTGHLRRNIEKEVDRKELVGRVGTNVLYGKWLELGTRKMKRRPWLSRAMNEMAARIKQIMEMGK